MNKMEEMVRVCSWCREIINVVRTGEDHLDHCSGCQLIEGETEEITVAQYESENP